MTWKSHLAPHDRARALCLCAPTEKTSTRSISRHDIWVWHFLQRIESTNGLKCTRNKLWVGVVLPWWYDSSEWDPTFKNRMKKDKNHILVNTITLAWLYTRTWEKGGFFKKKKVMMSRPALLLCVHLLKWKP